MHERVVIYRIGSIGDTAVALPALKLIARAFSDAHRVLLTSSEPAEYEPPAQLIIGGMGLIHDYLYYPIGTRDPGKLWNLRREIASLQPEAVIYLVSGRGAFSTWRNIAFLRACGVSHIIGAPRTSDLRRCRQDPDTGLWEQEGRRLMRCLAADGLVPRGDLDAWMLDLTRSERSAAEEALSGWSGAEKFIALAAGAKVSVKDWTAENWLAVVSRLTRFYPGWGLAFVGAGAERERSDLLASSWKGPAINLCGRLSPRISAAVMERAKLFVGHDGGLMHLAAAVGVPIVAVFSARAQPGAWFPYSSDAEILYRQVPCAGCNLEVCVTERKKCILDIRPDEVVAACRRRLEASSASASALDGLSQ
jgi:heptosyltransferase-3